MGAAGEATSLKGRWMEEDCYSINNSLVIQKNCFAHFSSCDDAQYEFMTPRYGFVSLFFNAITLFVDAQVSRIQITYQ